MLKAGSPELKSMARAGAHTWQKLVRLAASRLLISQRSTEGSQTVTRQLDVATLGGTGYSNARHCASLHLNHNSPRQSGKELVAVVSDINLAAHDFSVKVLSVAIHHRGGMGLTQRGAHPTRPAPFHALRRD